MCEVLLKMFSVCQCFSFFSFSFVPCSKQNLIESKYKSSINQYFNVKGMPCLKRYFVYDGEMEEMS